MTMTSRRVLITVRAFESVETVLSLSVSERTWAEYAVVVELADLGEFADPAR